MRARAIWRTAVPAVVIALAVAPGAQAQSVAEQRASIEVFRDYAPDGRISPCKHSSRTLELAQGAVPPDIEQYAADYPAAIAAALEARARGECEPGSPKTALAVPAATATPAPAPTAAPPAASTEGAAQQRVVPEPPAPETTPVAARAAAGPDAALDRVATASAANDAPVPVLLLGVLALILAIVALALFAMKRFGVDDRLAGAAHAIREARWRTAGTWQDFLDWVRLGR